MKIGDKVRIISGILKGFTGTIVGQRIARPILCIQFEKYDRKRINEILNSVHLTLNNGAMADEGPFESGSCLWFLSKEVEVINTSFKIGEKVTVSKEYSWLANLPSHQGIIVNFSNYTKDPLVLFPEVPAGTLPLHRGHSNNIKKSKKYPLKCCYVPTNYLSLGWENLSVDQVDSLDPSEMLVDPREDIQGHRLKIGDNVLIMTKDTPYYNGRKAEVISLSETYKGMPAIGVTIQDVDALHKYCFRAAELLYLPLDSLCPENISMETHHYMRNQITAYLWAGCTTGTTHHSGEVGRLVKKVQALCSLSDTFDLYYGIYRIAIPRLFGLPTVEDKK